jgi:hypothetical protein
MSQMPNIDGLLEADEKNVRRMRELFAGYQGLSELLDEASVLYTTCCHAFGQTLNYEINSLPRDTPPDSPVVGKMLAKRYRCLLFTRIGVLYATAVGDLLRMRLTAPLGYIRLQCESIALIKLMSDNVLIAEQWATIQTDEQGKDFFNKHQSRVKVLLRTYDLLDTYNQASGSALHSRLIGLAFGYQHSNYSTRLA